MIRVEVIDAEVQFIHQPFVRPLLISSGAIDGATEARVSVRARIGGKEVVGKGSIYLSVLWAWPISTLISQEREDILRRACLYIAEHLRDLTSSDTGFVDHPLVLGMNLHSNVCGSQSFTNMLASQDPPPVLALAMVLSPFDAAIHDATGNALKCSAFDLYNRSFEAPGVDEYFPEGVQIAIRRTLRATPLKRLPAWLIVGKHDDLDVDVMPWVVERGYTCMKLKTTGTDIFADIERTVEVYKSLRDWGVDEPRLSVDCNEASPDIATVLTYLNGLKQRDRHAFSSLEYMEQPTGRDIAVHSFDWREITRFKPVYLDEGLNDLSLLSLAKQQGWSGFALKTCKGHSFALVCAAWAHEHGLSLSLQDLTNPGYSAMHSALFAGYVPTVNGLELNSPQFTPEANRSWADRFSGLFEPYDGFHRLDFETPNGLGSESMDGIHSSVNE